MYIFKSEGVELLVLFGWPSSQAGMVLTSSSPLTFNFKVPLRPKNFTDTQ